MTERPFEETMAELERVVRELEDGQLGLDDALGNYEQGVALIRQAQAQLQQAELRIQLLARVEPDGEPVLAPFQHEATDRRQPSGGRSRSGNR